MTSSIGNAHEVVGVKGDEILDAVGHGPLHILQGLLDARGDLQSVGPGLLVDADKTRGHAVETVEVNVLLPADLGPGNVPEAHDGAAVLAGAQDDVFILVGFGKLGLRHHREGHLRLARIRLLPDLAGAEQGVLVGHGLLDVALW